MTQHAPTLLILFLMITGMLMVYLAAWAQLHSRVTAAREFSWLMMATVMYTLGYAIEISRSDLAGVLEAVKIEYLGIAPIPALMLFFTLKFIGKKLHWLAIIPIMAIPVITLLLVLTVEHHTLFYINPRVTFDGPFPVFAFERGAWYLVHFAYIQIAPAVVSVLLILHSMRTGAKYRKQAVLIAIGSLVPLLAGAGYLVGLFQGIDPTPFSMALSGLIMCIALFKFGLFELVPAARELAIDSIRDSFLVFDRQNRLQDLNNAAWRLPGASQLKIGDCLPPENPLTLELEPLLSHTSSLAEFSMESAEHGHRYFKAAAYPIRTKTGSPGGTAILISDVSETTSLVRQLNQLANTDGLTGTLNRRFLIELSALELANASRLKEPVSIIMIDLDHYKEVNDRYGHAAGDEVLKNVVQSFKRTLRASDILGRYGGDEFMIFLPGTDQPTAVQVAERLRQSLLERPLVVDGKDIAVTASFGVHSGHPDSETKIDSLKEIADRALYQAKANGRNCVAWR